VRSQKFSPGLKARPNFRAVRVPLRQGRENWFAPVYLGLHPKLSQHGPSALGVVFVSTGNAVFNYGSANHAITRPFQFTDHFAPLVS
jgi:hypothetical protein